MKIGEVGGLIADKIIVYKQVPGNLVFSDLYKGYFSDIPSDIADLEIKSIGAAKKMVVDIRVN